MSKAPEREQAPPDPDPTGFLAQIDRPRVHHAARSSLRALLMLVPIQ